MKTTTIDEVYQYTHKLIKKNSELESKIRRLVALSTSRQDKKYICTGLRVDGIYLGLDFNIRHIDRFVKILVNNIAVDRISFYNVDLSRVLLRIMVDGNHVANLTEDVSENGTFKIDDKGCLIGSYEEYLTMTFGNNTEDLQRCVFIIYNKYSFLKRREGIEKPELIAIRMPIIDLDHVDPIKILEPFFQEIEKDVKAKLDSYTLEI